MRYPQNTFSSWRSGEPAMKWIKFTIHLLRSVVSRGSLSLWWQVFLTLNFAASTRARYCMGCVLHRATYLCHLSCCIAFCTQVHQSQSRWYAPRGKENVFALVGLIQLVEKINCKLANWCWDQFHCYNLERGKRQNCTIWIIKIIYAVHIREKCYMCNTMYWHPLKLIA